MTYHLNACISYNADVLLYRHEIFQFRNFHDLRGHSRGNRRSDLIFMGGGGVTIYSVCSLSVSNAGTARHKSSQASVVGYTVYTMSTFTSIYCNMLYSLCMKFQAELVNFQDQLENRVLCKTFHLVRTRKFTQA